VDRHTDRTPPNAQPFPVAAQRYDNHWEPESQVDRRIRELEAANRKLEQELRRHQMLEQYFGSQQAQMRAVFAAMTEIVLIVDVSHATVQVLPTYHVLHPSDETMDLISATCNEFFADAAEHFWQPVHQAINQQTTIRFEYSVSVGDRTLRAIAHISPISDHTTAWVAREIDLSSQHDTTLQQIAADLERQASEQTAALQESHDILVEEIRERVQTQIKLSKLEQQFRLAVDNIPDMFVIYDSQRRYQFVNAEGVRRSGKSIHDLLGAIDEDLFGTDVTKQYLPLLQKAVATRTVQTQECTLNLPETGSYTAIFTYVPLLDEQGNLLKILGIAHDITQHKRSQEALKAAKDQLQAVLDAVPGFVSWVETRTDPPNQDDRESPAPPILRYLGVNHHLANSFNLLPTAFVGHELGFLEGPSQYTEFMLEFMKKEALSASQAIDLQINGLRYSYLIAAQKYRNNTAAVSVGIDITERKTAEESLHYQLAFEQTIMSISTDFINLKSDEIDQGIDRALQKIAQFTEVDLSYVFLFNEDGTDMSLTHAGTSVGRKSQIVPLLKTLFSSYPEARATLLQGEVLYLQNLKLGWRDTACELVHDVKSAICVPTLYQGRTIGFIGFSSIGQTKYWSDSCIGLLRIVGEIFTNTLQRRIAETELRHSERKYQLAYQRTQLLSEVTLKIRNSLELEEILQTSVEEVQKILDASRVLIFQLQSDATGVVVREAVQPHWTALQGREITDPAFYCDIHQPVRLGQVSAIADWQEIATHFPQTDGSHCVRARLVVPIFIPSAGKKRVGRETFPLLWGFLIAHQCDRTRHWKIFEVELLQQLADQMGIAITHAQLINNLEDVVSQRTAELLAANHSLQHEIRDRRRAERALRRSEQQLRLTTDALPVLICYVDAQQRYRFNNRAYEDCWGKPRSDITGHYLWEVLGEEVYNTRLPHVQAALSGARVSYETQYTDASGKTRHVSLTYIPDVADTGDIKGYFGVEIDISERKAVEQMKDEFLSVASHELRTPLTSIRGSLGLLATNRLGALSSQGQRMLDIALNNTDRLCRLINDILDLQRMESGQVPLLKQCCNAQHLLVQAIEIVQGMAQEAGVTLHAESPPTGLTIWANCDQILQTLTNLIGNAIKFSPPGETIHLAVSACDRDVLFQVRDRGRGIPNDKLETVFGRFQQVDASDSRQKGGTGLGLAICRQIINQHDGEIWAESVLGEGSTFYFTLPVSPTCECDRPDCGSG
jgi:PAS domain S-box-containing protein